MTDQTHVNDDAQDPVLITAYNLHRQGSELALSPNDEKVAFIVKEVDQTSDSWSRSLFVTPADGSEPPHRLTRLSSARSPIWSPAGDQIAVLAH
jgi:Tol biopolymer transport system component